MIFEAVKALGPKQKKIFMLKLNGVSNYEITQRMDISLRNCVNQYSSAVRFLRQAFGSDYKSPRRVVNKAQPKSKTYKSFRQLSELKTALQ